METNLQKIKELVDASPLSPADQKNFLEALGGVKDEELKSLADLFTRDPASIEDVYLNYQVKIAVLRANNGELWKTIVGEEVKKLEQKP